MPAAQPDDLPKLENPMSVQYLQKHLRREHPRLVLTPEIEAKLKHQLAADPVVQNVYKAIQLNAAAIQDKPLLKRVLTGRRMLSVSREAVYRMNMLGMVYRIERAPEVLKRINDELTAVSGFSDWNPSHFLDTAEMSLAVAIGLDWTGGDLPESTVELAQTALIEKGIRPGFETNSGWQGVVNNWNQVCFGGMVAAAIAIADREPDLAAKTISRALNNMPLALKEYGPDGLYPEGASYWSYGTGYSVVTASMLESAFGTDFGLSDFRGFKESALFRKLMDAPAERLYNFGDCSDRRQANGDFVLAWFAARTGNQVFREADRFLRPPDEMGKLSRHGGVGMVWLSQYRETDATPLPTAWKGDGINPVVVFTGGPNDPRGYYFGGKGGSASISHGTMDAGSFVFDLDGVRWSLDMGNQNYHALEKTGFKLWGRGQDAERWTLLTKNNFGHSTLTVNGQRHRVDATATLLAFQDGDSPKATIDLTPIFGGLLERAHRKFVKDGPTSIVIEDHLKLSEDAHQVVWQLMTEAEVTVVDGGVILRQDGKRLNVENLSHPSLSISVVSLDPPPLDLDRKWKGLKRLELNLPAQAFENGEGTVRIRLVAANASPVSGSQEQE